VCVLISIIKDMALKGFLLMLPISSSFLELFSGTIDHCGRGARAKKAHPLYILGTFE
jgi:hypothetical protein